MIIDFKILRVDILSKFFLKITLIEILNFSCWYSPIILDFQLGNKYFWKFPQWIIYSLGKLLMVLKCSYISQKIKWERALGKPTTFIIKPILIWVHHHSHGGLALRIRRYGLFTWTRLDMSVVGRPSLWWGSLLGDINSSRTMVIHLTLYMKWYNCPMRSRLHSPQAK